VVFWFSLVILGAIVHLEVLTFLGSAQIFLGTYPLGVFFHHGEVYILCLHLVLGLSSLGLNLGTYFLEVAPFPLRGIFSYGRSHALGGGTIPVGTHSLGSPQPSIITNIGGL
jgi:hypothetical protein